MSDWTLFSNHGHVLVCLSRDSEARLRDVALDVGITERAVQKIVRDLQDSGMISVTKNGRRNSYRIHGKTSLRHDLESACTLKDLIKFVNKHSGSGRSNATEKGITRKSQPLKSGSQTGEEKPGSQVTEKKKPVEKTPVKVESAKPGPVVDGTEDSTSSESKERQQGFLF